MDTLRFVAERGNERFEIIEGSGEGFYVVRYVGGQDTHDYLQDTVVAALGTAEEYWQVHPTAWREAREGELPLWRNGKGG
jgi:hypothetical protein